MTSQPIRNQVEDHLLTPKNATLIIIDYQPPQVSSIVSMDHLTLVSNIVATARLAKVFALPIVLSTVNVKTGRSGPTIHQLAEVLAGIEELDRTTINAWEDEEFVTAVKATGREWYGYCDYKRRPYRRSLYVAHDLMGSRPCGKRWRVR